MALDASVVVMTGRIAAFARNLRTRIAAARAPPAMVAITIMVAPLMDAVGV